jgi:histidine phosphotransferase ChpT
MQIDLKVAQLLSSRLCHDLVGPVGAVNTGLELMQENSDDDGAALGLVVRSAAEATRRLAFYRIAFGFGGADGPSGLDEARALAAGLLESGKVTLDWPDHSGVALGPVPTGVVKVVLNMILMAVESLPRGGVAGLSIHRLDEGLGIGLTATGEGATLRKDLVDALAEDTAAVVDTLSARNVHAYLAQCLARGLGGRIEHSEGSGGEIQLAVLFPNVADC